MAFHDDSAVQPGRCFLLVNMCIYTSPVVSVGQVRLVENFRCASGDSLAEQVADTFVLPEDGCNDRHIADLGRIRQFFDNTGCPQQYGAVFITPYELDALLPGRVRVGNIGRFCRCQPRLYSINFIHFIEIGQRFVPVRVFGQHHFRIYRNSKQSSGTLHHFFPAFEVYFGFRHFTFQCFQIRNPLCLQQSDRTFPAFPVGRSFFRPVAVQQVRMGDRSKFSQFTFPFP